MADLDASERAKVALRPNETLRVVAAGTTNVTVLEGGTLGTTAVTNNTTDFGPYSTSARLLVECVSGRASYGLADDPPQLSAADILALQLGLSISQILAPYFEDYRARMLGLTAPVPNTATVVYIDPTSGTNGVGTFADPRNSWPTLATDTTYLLRERTRIASSAAVTGITATGVVIGTYDAATGARVFDPERLATIESTVAFNFRCAVRWQGTSGSFTLAGVRLIGGYNAGGGVQLFESITAPATSVVTVEHSVFEFIGAAALSSSQVASQGINVAGARLVARFNRIAVEGDGIFHAPAAGAGFDFLCNEITVPSTVAAGGSDCIQVLRTGASAIGRWRCAGNWLRQLANTKQAFIISGGTPQSAGEEGIFMRNFLLGVDCQLNPVLAPFSVGQIAYINDSTSATWVVSNFFHQFLGWASVPSNSLLAHNIGIRDHASADWLAGFSTAVGSSNSVVANNTAIARNTRWGSAATNKGIEVFGSGHTTKGNLMVNMGMRLSPGLVESNSIFVGSRAFDTNGTLLALGSGSQSIGDARLDPVGRPYASSAIMTAGDEFAFGGAPMRLPDPFGRTAVAPTVPWVGAAQASMLL